MSCSTTIEQYQTAYDEADGFAREVGEFLGDAAIPAHNELRYAGHHLLQAVTDSKQTGVLSPRQLLKAKLHCDRATYEASEAGIAYAVDGVHDFKSDYRELNIRKHLPEWPEFLRVARTATDLVSKGRQHATPQDYMVHFQRLVDICHTLDEARDDLNAEILQSKKDDQKFLTQIRAMVIVGLLGIAVGAAGTATTIFLVHGSTLTPAQTSVTPTDK